MKLRNRQTGGLANILGEQEFFRVYTDAGWADYGSLAELNEEWEDAPVEPLIKDEKIRKAVRAWTEANDIDKVAVQNNYCLTSEEDEEVEIVFTSPVFKEYADFDDFIAIDELCGEEEE